MKTNELRKKYIDFFKDKDHKFFPSDTLVPDDSSVMFTSAGMNQFKTYFLGEKKDVVKATSCQKCLRTGDLERVGKTAYHHTFFEMLGNFSFGNYFKKQAIEYAWEFLLKVINIKEENLWVSVYDQDNESFNIWKEDIGINPNKIVRLGEDDNFWPANAPTLGPNGPCGPCSEIFYDWGRNVGCGKKDCSPACSCGRFVEVWNLVFTQFNRVDKDILEPLPQKNIDTGMGLERMASVLQQKKTNFEIDIFMPIVECLTEGLKVAISDLKIRSIIYAIADHLRAVAFSIADGVYPSNEDRGYIIRKLIRIAVWKKSLLKKQALGFSFTRLIPIYVELMKEQYPELSQKEDVISKIIRAEEEKFTNTLDEGKKQISVILKRLKKDREKIIPGQDCFRLYDTYGFPLELSKEVAKDFEIDVDQDSFNTVMGQQRMRSRTTSKFNQEIFQKGQNYGIDCVTEFCGYDFYELETEIIAFGEISAAEKFIVLKKTPFYPQGGGQLADKGTIKTGKGSFEVIKVLKESGDVIVHYGKVIEGEIELGKATALVNFDRRNALMRAHTATHLLQAVLRMVLGEHIAQQGSLVEEDRIRFDFAHFQGLTKEELREIESKVNAYILNACLVKKEICDYTQAKKQGVLAFFTEKYKEKVRVVNIGDFSSELCGGTHIHNTSMIGTFVIINETSISSGVRRIEALVGKIAQQYIAKLKLTVDDLSNTFACSSEQLSTNVNKMLDESKKKDQEIKRLQQQLALQNVDEVIKEKKQIGKVSFFTYIFDQVSKENLLHVADVIRQKVSSAFILLISRQEDKSFFLCSVTQDYLNRKISAKEFVGYAQDKLGLKGGGREALVQGVASLKNLDRAVIEEVFSQWVNQNKI